MKWLLYFLIFCMLFSSAFAEPPFSQTNVEITPGSGIEIVVPKNEYFPIDESFTLHYHVFNGTGHVLTNETTVCYIHVYGVNNTHLIEEQLLMDSNLVDFYIDLNSSFASTARLIPYIVYCNNTFGEAGFFSSTIEIRDSLHSDELKNDWLAIIISLSVMTFLLYVPAVIMKDKKLKFIKGFFFLIAVGNTFVLGTYPFLITLNPGLPGSFKPVAIGLLSVNALCLIYFIWTYGAHLAMRIFKKTESED